MTWWRALWIGICLEVEAWVEYFRSGGSYLQSDEDVWVNYDAGARV